MSLNRLPLSEVGIGMAVLAAGASSRLGQAKQLVLFREKTLLQNVVDEADKADVKRRWVILGANAEAIQKRVDFKSFECIQNHHWEEGMASSVRIAVDKAEKENLDALLIVLSDQPYLTSELLSELIRFYRPNKGLIMASEYNDILGVPALFDRVYYQELMKLSGDTGARKLINAFRAKVKSVPFKKGWMDIDTPEDLKRLKKSENGHND